MKIKFKIKVGKTKIEIRDEAETQVEAIQKIAAWQGIEVSASANGQEWPDLRFCHRVVKDRKGEDCVYQSIVSDKNGMEFKLGHSRKRKGEVFPKAWERIQRKNTYQDEDAESDQSDHESAGTNREENSQTTAEDSSAAKETELKPVTQGGANRSDATTRALAHVKAGHVKVFGQGKGRTWRVGPPGADVEVWKDVDKPHCGCAELAKLRRQDAVASCEHIIAVRLYHEALAQAGQGVS